MEESTIALIALAVGGAYAVKKQRDKKKAPIDTSNPDIPEILDDIEESPAKAIDFVEEEKKVVAPTPAKNPIKEAIEKIVYKLNTDDLRRFREFGILDSKGLVSQDYSGAKYLMGQVQSRIKELEKKLETGDFGPSITDKTRELIEYILTVIANDEMPFSFQSEWREWGEQLNTYRKGQWNEAFVHFDSERKRIKQKDSKGFYAELRQLKDGSEEKNKLRLDFANDRVYTIFSDDYSKDLDELLASSIALMRFWETKNIERYMGSGASILENKKIEIDHANNKFDSFHDKVKSLIQIMGKSSPLSVKVKIEEEKESLAKYESIVATGDKLYAENYNKTKYIKYLKEAPTNKYDPEHINDLEAELREAKNSLRENNFKKKELGKKEFELIKNFFETKIKLLEKLIKHIDAFKLTDAGKYKYSKVIKKLPASFPYTGQMEYFAKIFQLANIGFHPDHVGPSMDILAELYIFELDKKTMPPVLKECFEKIIDDRQKAFTKIFPDAVFTFDNLRQKAKYLKEARPWIEQFIELPKKESRKKESAYYAAREKFQMVYGDLNPEELKGESRLLFDELQNAKKERDIYRKIALSVDFTKILEMMNTFYFKRKNYQTELNNSKVELKKIQDMADDLTVRLEDATDEDNKINIRFMRYLTIQAHWYLKKVFEIKEKAYVNYESEYKRNTRAKFTTLAIKEIENQLANPEQIKFHIPKGHFSFPREVGENWLAYKFNPSLDYSESLSTRIITKYVNDPKNPIGKTDSMVLLMDFWDVDVSLYSIEKFYTLYVKLVQKMGQVRTAYINAQLKPFIGSASGPKEAFERGMIKEFTNSDEYVFYNYLFFKLLQTVEVEADPRRLIKIQNDFSKDEVKKAVEFLVGEHNKIENYKITRSSEIKDFWLRACKGFYESNSFSSSSFEDIGFVKSEGLMNVIKNGFMDFPDLDFVMSWAEYRDTMPVKAVNEIHIIVEMYRSKYLSTWSGKFKNMEHGHSNYLYIMPSFKNKINVWFAVKGEITRAQTTTVDEVFKEYVSYLEYYEKNGSDAGWTGKYAYMFKSDRTRAELSGLEYGSQLGLITLGELEYDIDHGTMGGFFSDIVRAVTKPVKKAFKEVKKVVSPITGKLVEELSPLEKLVLRPVAQTLRKGIYEVIPKEVFDGLWKFTKMPGHLVQGKLSAKDFRNAIRGAIRFNMYIVSGGKVGQSIQKKQSQFVRQSIKNNSILSDLDKYSGGLLTSGQNILDMDREIAQGKKIDTLYILMRTIDGLKVYGAVTGGAFGVAANVAVNYAAEETSLGESSTGRLALQIVGTAGAIYASSGWVDAPKGTVQNQLGIKVFDKTKRVTMQEALKQAAIGESKNVAKRVAAREAIKQTNLENSEIGKAAITIGVESTVDSIDSTQGVSDIFKDRAKAKAVQVSQERADKKLADIDPNISVKNLNRIYKAKDKNLVDIMADAKNKFVEDVKSGRAKDRVIKEVDRFVVRELQEQFADTLGHYGEEMLGFLMWKYGPKWDYDYHVVPQDYIDYQFWILRRNPNDRLLRVNYGSKALLAGAGVALVAGSAIILLAGEEE